MSRSMNTSRTPKAPVRSLARCGSFQCANEQRAAAATKRIGAPEDPQEEEMFSKTHVDVDLGPPTHSKIIEETPEDLTSELSSPFDADSDPNLTSTQAFDTREEQNLTSPCSRSPEWTSIPPRTAPPASSPAAPFRVPPSSRPANPFSTPSQPPLRAR
ncbi:hypothetical protein LTR16_010076, partial [Cryomyces antarcticus]